MPGMQGRGAIYMLPTSLGHQLSGIASPFIPVFLGMR